MQWSIAEKLEQEVRKTKKKKKKKKNDRITGTVGPVSGELGKTKAQVLSGIGIRAGGIGRTVTTPIGVIVDGWQTQKVSSKNDNKKNKIKKDQTRPSRSQ